MSGDSKFFVTVLAVGVLVVVGFFIFGKSSPSQTVEIDTSVGHKLGSDSAVVKIVEFGDFQCPACKAAAPPLKEAYAKNGNIVQIIYRHIPLPSHQNSDESAQASEAAALQGKFWEMYDLLYANQESWQSLPDPFSVFESFATTLSLDLKKFRSDYKSSDSTKNVQRDKADADKYGVSSTPTFFVNGEKITGAQSVEAWQKIIDTKLAEAKK